MRTERVTFLTSAEHKAALDDFAASRGESVGNVVREATVRYMSQPSPSDEEAELAVLVGEMNEALPKMGASLDAISRTLRRTHIEVDQMLRAMGARR